MATDYVKKDFNARFVSDFNLPISIVRNEDLFQHALSIQEPYNNALTRYNNTIGSIDEFYGGDLNKFLVEYYNVRENIIQSILNNEAYKGFNEIDMNKVFSFKKPINVTHNGIYNQQNIGKTFISIDLKHANFQALKYADRNIVFNCKTYEDLIRKFCDNEFMYDYVSNSRYSRQVIFGKLNPKRTITVEKYIMSLIYEYVNDILSNSEAKIVSFNTDELIYEVSEKADKEILFNTIYCMYTYIKETMEFDVKINMFKLHGYKLTHFDHDGDNEKHVTDFYEKENLIDENHSSFELKCVPIQYFNIVYKLLNHKGITEKDMYFCYEKMTAKFCGHFVIEKF